MSRPRTDITGQMFGFLKALSCDGSDGKHVWWKCECTRCGKVVSVRQGCLTCGNQKSCGCLRAEKLSKRMTEYNIKNNPLKTKREPKPKPTKRTTPKPKLTTPIEQCEGCFYWRARSSEAGLKSGCICHYMLDTRKARNRTTDGTCLSRRPKKAHGTQQSYDDLMRSIDGGAKQ